MNDAILRLRPQALTEYFLARYVIQPGQGLCLVLGQPDAGDNAQALAAWVRDAVERHDGLDLCDQVHAIERELCRLMVDAGMADDPAARHALPAALVARVFGPKRLSPCDRQPGRAGRRRKAGSSDNVIPFPTGSHHG
ncbi:MAG: hypothetical protein EA370_13720 [Wenzhouxiangella sp.]|nr:MAG: hypothetical protein EA370_13720 [Wenzhouxiangella sp.]